MVIEPSLALPLCHSAAPGLPFPPLQNAILVFWPQVTVSPLHAPGAILLGDAFNMRHPLTGGWVGGWVGAAGLGWGIL